MRRWEMGFLNGRLFVNDPDIQAGFPALLTLVTHVTLGDVAFKLGRFRA